MCASSTVLPMVPTGGQLVGYLHTLLWLAYVSAVEQRRNPKLLL